MSPAEAHFYGGSDHKIIKTTRFTKSSVSKPRIIRKRCFKDFNAEQFIQSVRHISWWDLYACEDCESAVDILTAKLTMILDKIAPVKKIQVRTNYAPWISEPTKSLIKKRNEAQKQASETKCESDWEIFRKLRNSVNNKLRSEKIKWRSSKVAEYSQNSSTVWKNVKNWLGWSKGGPPSILVHDGAVYRKPLDLANIMNTFFIDKVKVLREKLVPATDDPLLLCKRIMQNRNCDFKLQFLHPDKVRYIISSIKSSKSCGVDDIDSFTIKLVGDELVPAITHIINLSISQCKFPDQWKLAKIIPLYKKNEVSLAKNYRPVSLLCTISKILERAIADQMMRYLEMNNILHPAHHGFRAGLNTTTALAQLFEIWSQAFDEGQTSAVLFLDLSSAFDVVDHSILLNKLKVSLSTIP